MHLSNSLKLCIHLSRCGDTVTFGYFFLEKGGIIGISFSNMCRIMGTF